MRPIHVAQLDETRAVLDLSHEVVRRSLSTEVGVGPSNGLEQSSVVACDHVTTIPADALGEQIGMLLDHQEQGLSEAIRSAFDLD
jgi:mRNA interferase MazF